MDHGGSISRSGLRTADRRRPFGPSRGASATRPGRRLRDRVADGVPVFATNIEGLPTTLADGRGGVNRNRGPTSHDDIAGAWTRDRGLSRPHFTASAVISPIRSPSSLQLSPPSWLWS